MHYTTLDNRHGGIQKLFDIIQTLVPTLADRAESVHDDAVEAQDALTVFHEEVERYYIARASLEDLYEQLRDIREGYYGNDLSGAIEKLYHQVIDMMEGN